MKALPFAALAILISLPCAANTVHLLSLQTASHQSAELMGDVEGDDNVVIQNPVLQVKGKTYRLASSEATPALNELICRKVGSNSRYAYARFKKRGKKESILEADKNFGLKKSKAKTVVREFHCVEEED